MVRRCPVCKEVLLTLRVGDLARCDTCEHFVDPEGEIIGLREGRILTALTEAADEPRTVAELDGMLGSRDPDELRELCERHRERVRRQIDALALPESVALEWVDPEEGTYREPGSPGLVRATFDNPTLGRSPAAHEAARLVATCGVFIALLSGCLASTMKSMDNWGTTFFIGAMVMIAFAVGFASKAGRPIREIRKEEGRDELEVFLIGRTGDRTLRVPVGECRLAATFAHGESESRTYVDLQSSQVETRLLVVRGDRDTGRAAVIRLEDALRLSGPAPAKKG
ncbi:MAG: hypothetical protein JJ863_36440 [Deltaproteobacteria bacterium]|nr:hypothetical protein [Deltaproteobacteria bacterium]